MENITNEYKQVLISGVLGDGHLTKSGAIMMSCIHEDYMLFKQKLAFGFSKEVKLKSNPGFKKDGMIYRFSTIPSDYGKHLYSLNLEELVSEIDELGLALWFYDDGSLHKKSYFYNINTHSFSLEDQENILIPLLNKFNIYPKIMPERKKDGRVFNYLYVGKYNGADKISAILNKYQVLSYSYKIWDEEYYNVFTEIDKTSDLPPRSKTKLISRKLKSLKNN